MLTMLVVGFFAGRSKPPTVLPLPKESGYREGIIEDNGNFRIYLTYAEIAQNKDIDNINVSLIISIDNGSLNDFVILARVIPRNMIDQNHEVTFKPPIKLNDGRNTSFKYLIVHKNIEGDEVKS